MTKAENSTYTTHTPCATCIFLKRCAYVTLYTFDDPFCWPESPYKAEFDAEYGGDFPNHKYWSMIEHCNQLDIPVVPKEYSDYEETTKRTRGASGSNSMGAANGMSIPALALALCDT